MTEHILTQDEIDELKEIYNGIAYSKDEESRKLYMGLFLAKYKDTIFLLISHGKEKVYSQRISDMPFPWSIMYRISSALRYGTIYYD